jgi:hypothetical protein
MAAHNDSQKMKSRYSIGEIAGYIHCSLACLGELMAMAPA